MPVLHLPAIAHEAGIDFPLEEVARLMRDTPHIADLKPGGRYVAKDVHDIGGVPVIIKALLDGGLLHGDCMTVTGKTLAENHAEVVFPTNQDVVRPVSDPISKIGGVVSLFGNLAPMAGS
jgi:dihydroxy-acid dehydratase